MNIDKVIERIREVASRKIAETNLDYYTGRYNGTIDFACWLLDILEREEKDDKENEK